ncbi:c-type cytochrome, partial [Sphingobium jiangsuense]|uniref:c-type cytochrome n=1 Tax=Sphingobium jiangsuense TaxID=870476 RepID=UPI0024E0A820
MTHRLFLSLALGAAMALAACSGGKGDAPAAPKREGPPPPPAPETVSSRPDAGPGEKLFLAKCAMCHGPGGMGAGLLARRSVPRHRSPIRQRLPASGCPRCPP